MTIPVLTPEGLLPPGIHSASMTEFEAAFGSTNDRRIALYAKLADFVVHIKPFGVFTSLFADGSFTTDKPVPGDIDVVLAMPRTGLAGLLAAPGGLALFDRGAIKKRYELDLFIQPEPPVPLMVGFFQGMRPEEALARKVPPGTSRGIVKVSL